MYTHLLSLFSIACIYLCPELNTWDWITSVGIFPWRKDSPSLNSCWLLVNWADTGTSSAYTYLLINTEIGIHLELEPCVISPVACHANWCHYALLIQETILLRSHESISYIMLGSLSSSWCPCPLVLTSLSPSFSMIFPESIWRGCIADVSVRVGHPIITYSLQFG